MAKLTYALEPGGSKRLEISWKGMYKDFMVKLDDEVIGELSGQKELKAGRQFALPDGSSLSVQLVQKLYSAELQILRNGQPLPGSSSDPENRLKNAYGMVFFVAGLNLFLGLIAWLFQVEFLQDIGIGFYSIIFGLVFLVLGFFVKRRSALALILAIAIFALDALLGLLAGGASYATGLVVRVILIIPMVQGVGAIRALKQRETTEY
ncbi:MAG: hypothetical protein ACK2UI_13590 [Anaerolineae bacterium]|jgi:hypothetical protein